MVAGFVLALLLGSRDTFEGPDAVLMMVFVQYVFLLALTICVVVPLRFMWRRWDFMRAWGAGMIGFGIGVLLVAFAGILMVRIPILAVDHVPLRAFIKVGLLSAAAGLVFWFIAKGEMRPNSSRERTRER